MNEQGNLLQTTVLILLVERESGYRKCMGWPRLEWVECDRALTVWSPGHVSCVFPLHHPDPLVWNPPRDCPLKKRVSIPERHSILLMRDLKMKLSRKGCCLPHVFRDRQAWSCLIGLMCCSKLFPRDWGTSHLERPGHLGSVQKFPNEIFFEELRGGYFFSL